VTVSPSQVSVYADCQRKWGWQYLNGLRPPQAASAQVGERVHKILEDWLQHGVAPDPEETLVLGEKVYHPGKIAESGLHLLPTPGPHLTIEQAFHSGIWTGRIDLAYMADVPVISDHKTSTDPKSWGKSEEDLRTDVQALVYASAALKATGAQEVDLIWNYFQTRPPFKPRQSKVRLNVLEVTQAMEPWEALGQEVEALRAKKGQLTALDMPPNPHACQKFGGCAFKNNCNLSPEEQIKGFLVQPQTMAEKMAAMKAGKANGQTVNAATINAQQSAPAAPPLPAFLAAPAAPPVPPAPQRDATPEDVPAIKALFMQGKTEVEMVLATNVHLEHVSAVLARYSVEWSREQNAGRVNPPEEPKTLLAEPAAIPVVALEEDADQFTSMDKAALVAFIAEHKLAVDAGRRQEKTIRELVRVAWKDAQTAASLGEAPVPVAPPAIPAAPPAIPVAPPVAPPAIPEAPVVPPVVSAAGFTLMIDCLPLSTSRRVLHARSVAREAIEYVQKQTGTADYRLVDYGKGPALLTVTLTEFLRKSPVEAGAIVVASKAQDKDLLEAFTRMASEIVVAAG
jgi:hypothetical protein